MKPTDKLFLALGLLAFLTFGVVNPFNWTDDDGNPVHVTPIQWMFYGILCYLLIRLAISAYKEWVNMQPKRTIVRNSRSHYNTRKEKK